jgi:hypothetical protein
MTLALGLWTRFQPMTQTLIKKLHDEKVIGDIKAVKTDFSMPFYDCVFNHLNDRRNPVTTKHLADDSQPFPPRTVLSPRRRPVDH